MSTQQTPGAHCFNRQEYSMNIAAIIGGLALVTFTFSFLIGRYLSGWSLRLSLQYAATMTLFLGALAGFAALLTMAVGK